jgi:hypothetical protein
VSPTFYIHDEDEFILIFTISYSLFYTKGIYL